MRRGFIKSFLSFLALRSIFADANSTEGDRSRITELVKRNLQNVPSTSFGFANDLFGIAWSNREMPYIGGDEFVQMYDDNIETRIIIRGYMDIDVVDGDNVSKIIYFCRCLQTQANAYSYSSFLYFLKDNGVILLFNDNPLYDIYGKERGRSHGTCASIDNSGSSGHYVCALTAEIIDDDGYVVAGYNLNGDIMNSEDYSKLTVKDGSGELGSVSGSHKLVPVKLNADTEPATPERSSDIEYFFFESVLYISSEYLQSVLEELS
jgi:hypothetical protein